MRLEVHSHFTLLGDTAPVEALAAHAAEEGMSHLALTDHQALYGAVAFARVCRRFSVRPITGMSMDMALPGETTVSGGQRGRLVLLAKNARGYRSLCYIASWLQGDPRRETRLRQGLAWELLAEHREGLLCIEGGQSGWLFNLLRAGREAEAIRNLSRLGGLFQDDARLGMEQQRPFDGSLAATVIEQGRRWKCRHEPGCNPGGVVITPAPPIVEAESPAQRLAWETHILG